MKIGITFVKKANMWLFYIAYNIENNQNVSEWFATKEQAEARLKQELEPEEHGNN